MKRKFESAYSKKLKLPQWQKIRAEVLARHECKCGNCGSDDKILHIHHRYYVANREPWDYPVASLIPLCEACHIEVQQTTYKPNWEALLLCFIADCEDSNYDGFCGDFYTTIQSLSKKYKISPFAVVIRLMVNARDTLSLYDNPKH